VLYHATLDFFVAFTQSQSRRAQGLPGNMGTEQKENHETVWKCPGRNLFVQESQKASHQNIPPSIRCIVGEGFLRIVGEGPLRMVGEGPLLTGKVGKAGLGSAIKA
jgi:hypothetical protein